MLNFITLQINLKFWFKLLSCSPNQPLLSSNLLHRYICSEQFFNKVYFSLATRSWLSKVSKLCEPGFLISKENAIDDFQVSIIRSMILWLFYQNKLLDYLLVNDRCFSMLFQIAQFKTVSRFCCYWHT